MTKTVAVLLMTSPHNLNLGCYIQKTCSNFNIQTVYIAEREQRNVHTRMLTSKNMQILMKQ